MDFNERKIALHKIIEALQNYYYYDMTEMIDKYGEKFWIDLKVEIRHTFANPFEVYSSIVTVYFNIKNIKKEEKHE